MAIVVDMWSGRIVGWTVRDDLTASLVVDALQMATTRRRPKPGCIFHPDRGASYTSVIYGQALSSAGLEASMGKRGCAYDNAVGESATSTIKTEIETINSGGPNSGRRAARLSVFDCIEAFCNRLRLHLALGHLSPEEFEMQHAYPQQPFDIPAGRQPFEPTTAAQARRRSDQLGSTPQTTPTRYPREPVKPGTNAFA